MRLEPRAVKQQCPEFAVCLLAMGGQHTRTTLTAIGGPPCGTWFKFGTRVQCVEISGGARERIRTRYLGAQNNANGRAPLEIKRSEV